MKHNSDNFRESPVLDIIEILRKKQTQMIIYEPLLSDGSEYYGLPVVNNLAEFKQQSGMILANRCEEELRDVRDRVYTRDLFGKD